MPIPEEDLAIALAVLEQKSTRWDPLADLFPAQRKFIEDPARFKAALCGRRAGKTTAVLREAIDVAQKGGRVSLIALTLDSARGLYWKPFKELREEHPFAAKLNETLLEASFPGGGEIKLRGADKPKEIEKIRGVPHDLVSISEAAFFGLYIAGLVEEVIEPSLLDRLGTLILECTPAAGMVGLFYDITRPEKDLRLGGWSVHEWTILDNPTIPHAELELEAIKKRHGWTEQTPKFIREYRGRWVRSNDDLVYQYDPKKNDFGDLPAGRNWHYILGVDVGFRDRTAFVVGAYTPTARDFYFVHTEAASGLIPAKIAERIQQLQKAYRPERMLMDCGALGLSIAEEFRQRYFLPIEAAEKKEKLAMVELLNGDLRAGTVKARRESPLAREWLSLQYDDHGKEDPRCKNDLCDAALYAFRAAYHYLGREPEKVDTKKAIQDRIEQAARAKHFPELASTTVDDEWD
jgi:hypothetical protein